ncbi:uroporphyrinogen-III C-methyltransferase [Natronoflexus pectinivorans]|uniref:uroporphyrinogen-III C-methyltransferase n=1 Tax=Natronoflexus pectinivorans TaxID=682526 RepID=A0A4R2GFU3_9BACT|nr:uroporphyrinogen-III C-methyltransferase [Natronoflexus pectinivorans]TCO07041.1 uroporphyrinogen III methyltransferase/synthase [Natronoflexus pectinivorans]
MTEHNIHKAQIANAGKVTLAGFGPGNSELLTVKAMNALKACDVIYYDDLLDASLLDQFPGEKIYVGKRSSNHAFSQDKINEQLYQSALEGKRVVRLKGGDPLIFGRGIEEYHYLAKRGINVELVPGISSAMAAAADALVPLTARGVSSSVVFLSGHDISKLVVPKAETLVFFMGASRQNQLAKRLLKEGWHPHTPVAVVQNASYAHSINKRYTLEQLECTDDLLVSPVIIIVGWTAAENNSHLPDKWLYTGSNITECRQEGMLIHSPLVSIEPADKYDDSEIAIKNIEQFNRIIFTSRHAVEHFFDRLTDARKDIRSLANVEIDVIGPVTAEALLKRGIIAEPPGLNSSSEDLVEFYKQNQIRSQSVLIPGSDKSSKYLPDTLSKLGNKITTIVLFYNRKPKNIVIHNLEEFHGIEFSSVPAVERFFEVYKAFPGHIEYAFRGQQSEQRFFELSGKLKKDLVTLLSD